MSNVHELGFLKDKIQELKDQGVYRKLPILNSPDDLSLIHISEPTRPLF